VRGIPAIGWINVSILSPLYACENWLASPFTGKSPPCKTSAALKILGVNRVVGVCLSPDLDMALNHCTAERVQPKHFAFASAGSLAGVEPESSRTAEVLLFQPTVGFIRMCPPGPS
jgi:hypothetical protein